eukprot:tig00001302_g8093.t1
MGSCCSASTAAEPGSYRAPHKWTYDRDDAPKDPRKSDRELRQLIAAVQAHRPKTPETEFEIVEDPLAGVQSGKEEDVKPPEPVVKPSFLYEKKEDARRRPSAENARRGAAEDRGPPAPVPAAAWGAGPRRRRWRWRWRGGRSGGPSAAPHSAAALAGAPSAPAPAPSAHGFGPAAPPRAAPPQPRVARSGSFHSQAPPSYAPHPSPSYASHPSPSFLLQAPQPAPPRTPGREASPSLLMPQPGAWPPDWPPTLGHPGPSASPLGGAYSAGAPAVAAPVRVIGAIAVGRTSSVPVIPSPASRPVSRSRPLGIPSLSAPLVPGYHTAGNPALYP